jgi:hypothetical protein
MRIGIEFAGDNGGDTFIRLSSGACDGIKVRSPPPDLVDPEVPVPGYESNGNDLFMNKTMKCCK